MWKSQKIVSWSHANKFLLEMFKRSRSEAFLGKGVLKIYSNFTGEYPRRSAICKVGSARQFYWNHTSTWCSPVNLLHIFRTPFTKKFFEGLLLDMVLWISKCIQRHFQSKIFVISAKVLKYMIKTVFWSQVCLGRLAGLTTLLMFTLVAFSWKFREIVDHKYLLRLTHFSPMFHPFLYPMNTWNYNTNRNNM